MRRWPRRAYHLCRENDAGRGPEPDRRIGLPGRSAEPGRMCSRDLPTGTQWHPGPRTGPTVHQKPEDPFLLRDVAFVLLDCGVRPEECYRLQWEQVRDGALHVVYGKTANARRSIPLTARRGRAGNETIDGDFSVGLPGSREERTYRTIDPSESSTKRLLHVLASIISRSTRFGTRASRDGRSRRTLIPWLTSRATATSVPRAAMYIRTWSRVGPRWNGPAPLWVGTVLGTLQNRPIQDIAKGSPYSSEGERVVWYAR